ncbi:uncharacterized protein LOC116351105 [Contarinia nasturtii]|uniref:uncharacterized protein LOC116351105 n=1 Tax=Contarinia nasturtii TaxID=265458 RepID=UPI0012D4B8EB|nr:uncharacterized protein LOC116351105 [Contarinia nasturtii]
MIRSIVYFGLLLALVLMMVNKAEGSGRPRRIRTGRNRNVDDDNESSQYSGAYTTGTFARTARNRGYDVSNLVGDLGNIHLDTPSGPTSGYGQGYGYGQEASHGYVASHADGVSQGYGYDQEAFHDSGSSHAGGYSQEASHTGGHEYSQEAAHTGDDGPAISRSSTSLSRSFARSVSKSLSQSFRRGKSKAEFNVDDLQYDGEPITFACIAKADRREFYVAHVNDTIPDYLVKRLSNNRGLSLFFLGAANEINSASGLLFKFAREWFVTSGNNICFVSYCYLDKPRTGCQAIGYLDKLVATNRLEYVAKMARDLVLNVRYQSYFTAGNYILHMSRVDVTGFSFGAHIAGRTAEYLLKKTSGKVRMLLALDPSRTPPVLAKTPKDTIKPDLAEYVQVIHTSSVQGMTKTRLGHVDIYARLNGGRILSNNHGLAFFLHVATATKRFYIVADEGSKGKGKLVQIQGDILPQPKSNECQLGIYAVLNENHIGQKFGFSLTKREELFFSALGQYADPSVFSD